MDINQLLYIGSNRYGQSGTGEQTHNLNFQNPISYSFPIFIKQVSCGSHHSALLTIDGFVYAMGSNIHGTLGTSSSNLNYSFTPILVQDLGEVSKIWSGAFHMAALSQGKLYMWGKGTDGQLANGMAKNCFKPTLISNNIFSDQVEDVSLGTNHTIVLTTNGVAFGFGNGIFGQLGTGTNRNYSTPMKVKLDNIEAISAGCNHSLFLVEGFVYATGDNTLGQLGIGDSNKKYVQQPIKVLGIQKVMVIQASKFSAALTKQGQLYVWGGKFKQKVPFKLDRKGENIVDIRAGNQLLYGLSSKGQLWFWRMDVQKIDDIKMKGIQIQSKTVILDFSIGQNHSLILGDIVTQIPYNNSIPKYLKPFDIKNYLSQNSIMSFQNKQQLSLANQFPNTISESDQACISQDQNIQSVKIQQSFLPKRVKDLNLVSKQTDNHKLNALNLKIQSISRFQSSSESFDQQNISNSNQIEQSNNNTSQNQRNNKNINRQNHLCFSEQHLQKIDKIIEFMNQSRQIRNHIINQNVNDFQNILNGKNIKKNIKRQTVLQPIIDFDNIQNKTGENKIGIKNQKNLTKDLIKQLRKKQLKISEMQETLSRRQIELQAKTQMITILRDMIGEKIERF